MKEHHFGVKYQIKNLNYEVLEDSPNHKMGLAHGVGLAYLKDGTFANVNVYFVFDYINGGGNFIENYIIQFKDSSIISLKAEGNSYGTESDPLFSAKVIILKGTGSYANIKGDGKMTGNRKKNLDESATVNLSFEIKYSD
jgi:hypothetical protein